MNLETFFEEKGIPYTHWEIEHNGQTNFIDSDVVIEAILSTEGTERRKIADTLSALDFANASIVHYLRFLAECMIKQRSC